MIEKAKEKPIEVKGRGGKAAALSIIGSLWMLMSVGGIALSALPSCDSADTKSLVGEIINALPLGGCPRMILQRPFTYADTIFFD